ncbi:hypothetical protein KVF89_16345 [Nocardioides carbamazepini]|uniref:hypothetical protein n=1 Tax=Nocardioides carbamazepini TaxID=2854259 RepID=UPI002149C741|nr:hypothetical protein [Nocardioides carbamazepini]MCR1784111.1 hypothetical protein [Nocardioides carbamazepini]
MRVDLTDDDLIEAGRTQFSLLLGACARYDEGDEAEHFNIALRLRILLHHTSGRTKALLEHFGALDQSWWVASGSDVMDGDLLPKTSLLMLGAFDGSPAWTPRFDQFGDLPRLPWQVQVKYVTRNRPVPRPGGTGRGFTDWWDQTVIRDATGAHFSRRKLVKAVADMGGGAHVDRSIDGDHHSLTRHNALQIYVGEDKPKASPVPASLRQIAWEVHAMTAEHLPHLLPSGHVLPTRQT